MNWLISIRAELALVCFAALAHLAARFWQRKRDSRGPDTGVDFRPSIGFTRLDGGASLAVLLENKSDESVWTEEIEIILTNLLANDQAADTSLREIHKIRQTIQPGDMLPVSLVEPIYKAAGRPQRKYSCVMSATVRYRAGEDWYEKEMQPQSLRMAGLTIVSNYRAPWTKSAFQTQENPRPQTVGAKSK